VAGVSRDHVTTAAGPDAMTLADPCQCMRHHAYIAPFHDGHCCFWPATQTCHQAEVTAWEDEHRRLNPGWEPR
jgi:hypothetical protein